MSNRALWIADYILPHERELRRWLATRLPAGVEVDDVVQEAYAVLADIESVQHIRDPRAYLFTTAKSVLLQQVRRARIVRFETVAELRLLDIESDEPGPERKAAAGEELRYITHLIAALPAKAKQAFVLRRLEGVSQKEIAERMKISESTVEKHIIKALRVLMEGMKGSKERAVTRSVSLAVMEEGHGNGQTN